MALCTTLNPTSTEVATQHHANATLWKLQMTYDTPLETLLDFDPIHHLRFVEGLNRSFSVENNATPSNRASKSARRCSLQVSQSTLTSQMSINIVNDSSFVAVPEEDDSEQNFSTKTPYRVPSPDHILSSPPAGYKPIGVQLLARHGSRTLTTQDFDQQALKTWQRAQQLNMLTPLGEELRTDIDRFMAENNRVGRGELTQLGKNEHVGLGARLFSRFPALFSSPNTVTMMTSGKKRVVDSAQHFLQGLTQSQPGVQICSRDPDKNLLYFHRSCPDYVAFKTGDPHVRAKLEAIKSLEKSKRYARQVLRKIYREEFVEQLSNGHCPTLLTETVFCLYSMFSVAPAQCDPAVKKMLWKYFSVDEFNWFSYINDAEEFYLKGPSVAGTTVTYNMAKPLLMDFFSSTAACVEQPDTSPAVHLRFAHAETVIPFASLLQIPNLCSQAADHADLYTYENNRWRGAHVASMAANIQWEIYQHETQPDEVLVRMLYNETEVRFKHGCQPIATDSFFYNWSEVRRSYAHVLSPTS